MPHLVLEYTANAPPSGELQELFARLHRILAEVGDIKIGNCKSRARPCETYYLADGKPEGAFVHLDVRILSGRTPELKREIGERLVEEVRQAFAASPDNKNLQVTVEIREIVRAHYFKYPEGSLAPPPQ